MAEAIAVSLGVPACVTFAVQSTGALYQTVASFQSYPRTAHELRQELEALNGVLMTLHEMASNTDVDLTMLQTPLLRYGQVCQDVEAMIVRFKAHSDGIRTSLRDWAKLQYMEKDMSGIRNLLAEYKCTFMIALGDVNM